MNRKAGRVTISDVAKAAKAGKTSVSRYLNGEQHVLSTDLKQRIENAIARLNYRPSLMARGLKRGRTRLIGLIIADITNPYSVEMMCGIEAACRAHGFTMLMCNTNNEVDQEQYYLNLMNSYQVEGIVVNAVGMEEEALNHLQQSLLPMVLIDLKNPKFDCDMVGLNNQQATTLATQHLIEEKWESVLFVTEPLGKVNTRNDRLNAFRATMAKYPERYTEQAEVRLADADGLDQVLQDFYQRHRKRRCAVMVVNGALTLQVARAMKRIGLDWGRQIGLLGFDELAWAELAGVGITTLQQPTWQIGYSALEKVIERINGDITPAKQQVFSGKLIIRGSTRFPS
ncbi:LacI family DNA-binding transcriptional regulator [Erwinia tracheiphila]|uniref:LacI family DNA-binding transcriptional regulator n=1 Tax=Erwinia tracheiphila TaxID=65700 RepID=A0A345CW78_9GAMM|nr:LacI family DNA-binding transcriptional regulator [Erwinia tracheiphila]AXF77695.1 LacI family DNA-binding transcriptional regulator [Erwinia tracheiphila]UIA83619.1 LacI family DNA-binding transcriptional regulator [Erwinia tracheiphila]UIA92204.1 LacI family DNA-binding transcriptional regulator [Erwinia tracheiphila]